LIGAGPKRYAEAVSFYEADIILGKYAFVAIEDDPVVGEIKLKAKLIPALE
jgi:hypothetical protein